MATVANVLTYAQLKAQTDTNGIDSTNTTGNGLAFCNDALLDMTRELIARNIDAAQTVESYATVTVTSTPVNMAIFAWPSDMFMLKTVEVNFTDTSQNNYLQASKVDVSNLQGDLSFDFLRNNQPNNQPLFTNHGDTGEIFPNQGCTVKIIYYVTPTEYTAFTGAGGTLAYPQTIDYRILGEKVAALYFESVEKPDMADRMEAKYHKRLNDLVKTLAPQSQQPIKSQGLNITGWEF